MNNRRLCTTIGIPCLQSQSNARAYIL